MTLHFPSGNCDRQAELDEAKTSVDKLQQKPVVILGAGINGAALARELVLNRVPVWVVDAADIACGATSRSSRLIHGGLRYLEYGDIGLVRESLVERSRLRHLAPQYVEPLRLFIPLGRRVSGLFQSAVRFLGAERSAMLRRVTAPLRGATRGLWAVRTGLWLYDRLVRDPEFPDSWLHRSSDPAVPRVDSSRFRWLCSYSDAQMRYPERFTVALLEDARQIASEAGIDFRVLTYHKTEARGESLHFQSLTRGSSLEVRPALIVNATGAWGDLTLDRLNVKARRLFGGTKGSHFITHHPALRAALGDAAVYAEAEDGRLIFVLPFGESVLVGTTDVRFEQPPDEAVASEEELRYLLQMTQGLFPDVGLERDDIDMHYSGVRPLPYAPSETAAAISRDHALEVQRDGAVPVMTLVGGKLTTCRALAEETADQILSEVGVPRVADSRTRPIPGGRDYPPSASRLQREWERLAERFGLSSDAVRSLWALFGNRVAEILERIAPLSGDFLPDTEIPREIVPWVIEHEWAKTLDDLVERRLMLLYRPHLSEACLHALAEHLVEPAAVESTVASYIQRLQRVYGKRVRAAAAVERQ